MTAMRNPLQAIASGRLGSDSPRVLQLGPTESEEPGAHCAISKERCSADAARHAFVLDHRNFGLNPLPTSEPPNRARS
jgi:hypothetical protein